jgi:septal ring factor EnvC (AmiA/AmiB activator)
MPLELTTVPAKTPVPFAKTKEFQDLQNAINNAKQSLDDVSEAVIAIEAKLRAPMSTNNVQDPAQRAQAALAAQSQNDGDLNEMLRIAGLRN